MTKIPLWLWLVGFVLAGCAFEYFWMVEFERLDKRLSWRQKMVTGVILLCVAAAALSYGLFKTYHR